MIDASKLASMFDHTNLKSWATTSDIDLLCREAIDYGFATVCVYGYWVPYIKENYPDVKISQVINFPDGLSTSHVATISQIDSYADEFDMVLNISKLKEKKLEELVDDIRSVKSYIGKKVLKVIVESGVLTQDELYDAIQVLEQGGADFIKTSTGKIPQSEDKLIDQVAHIQAYLKLRNISLEIKASGGIRSLDLVKILIGLGATRIGSSDSTRILYELGAR